MTASTDSIIVRRQLKTRRENVFKAFNNSSTLAQWLSPSSNVAVEVLEFQFVHGGCYRLHFTNPDGTTAKVGGTYNLINPPKELSFSWIWEKPDPMAGIITNVHIQFVEKKLGTEVVIHQTRLPSKEECSRHKMGWEGALNRLDCKLKNK